MAAVVFQAEALGDFWASPGVLYTGQNRHILRG